MPRTVRADGGRIQVGIPPVTQLAAQQLQPAPYNPRTMSPAMFESLKAGIRHYGLVQPLVVQRQSERHGDFVIVGGHQRLRAMREISIEDNVPLPPISVVLLDLDDRSAKLLNVSLNKVDGEFDAPLLAELVEDVHALRAITAEDEEILGMAHDEVSELLKLSEPPDPAPAESPTFGRSVTLGLVFGDVAKRDSVKAKLEEMAAAQKRTTGDVVLGLLSRKKR